MKKIKAFFSLALIAGILSLVSNRANAHCEIPCGIYGDSLRVALIYEHISTIEKSMNMIKQLSEDEHPDYNQLVRWINNKEEHAKKIQEIVSQYFLHQRVKIQTPDNEQAYRKYVNQLTSLHEILVYAMKTKQSTDLNLIDKLREKLHQFEHLYFEAEHKH